MNPLDKSTLDCRLLAEHLLGKPHRRSAKYAVWRCPFHQEQHGHSLTVYADGWKCWGKCQAGGDGISFAMKYYQVDFQEACRRLEIQRQPGPLVSKPPQPAAALGVKHRAPDLAWQTAAAQVVDRAQETLWSPAGVKARDYLRQRGLWEYWSRRARLGYIPGEPTAWRQIAGLSVPCGLLLPSFVEGQVWGLRVRRAQGSPKYLSVKGGKLVGSLFLGDELDRDHPQPVLFVEGEIDALSLAPYTAMYPVALSSASNSLTPYWIEKLLFFPHLLACLDADPAGQRATARLGALSQRVKSIQVPAPYKDPNEFLGAVGAVPFMEWCSIVQSEAAAQVRV